MQHRDTARGRRLRRATTISMGITGLVVSALVLTACTSTPTATNTANTNSGGNGAGSSGGGGSQSGDGQNTSPVSINVSPSGQSINPATPIVVKASNGTLTSVSVTNSVKGTPIAGSLSTDHTTWTSTDQLGYGYTYAVDAVGAGSGGGKPNEQKSTISTLKPAGLAYPNMVPAPASVAGTGVGVGEPVIFQFKQPVRNKAAVQAALTVTTTPSQPGQWFWIASNEVHYRAQNYWQPNTTIHVTANTFGVDFGGGVYGAEDRDVTLHVHNAIIAKADGNSEQMQVFNNGALVNTIPISMGKDSTPTHIGTHVVTAKAAQTVMDSCSYGVCSGPQAYKATEYNAVRISNDGEFVHENPNTVGVQGHDNVSHGCINVNQANSLWFFNYMNVGDVVEVTNSGGQQLPVWDALGDWSLPWPQWSKGNA